MVRALWKPLAVAAVAIAWSSAASAQILTLNDNRYLCRKVKDLPVAGRILVPPPVTTVDEVGADTCDLKKLFLLCYPVRQDGGPIDDPSQHYCCYKSRCTQKPAVNFLITDQFGPLRAQTKRPFVFCSPCLVVPGG